MQFSSVLSRSLPQSFRHFVFVSLLVLAETLGLPSSATASDQAMAEGDHPFVQRARELAERPGVDFPRTIPDGFIVTTYEAAGLRIYMKIADLQGRQGWRGCIPEVIHADVASPYLANNIAEVLGRRSSKLAWWIIGRPMRRCFMKWPPRQDGVIQVYYLGKPVTTLSYSLIDAENGLALAIKNPGMAPSVGSRPEFAELQAPLDAFWRAWTTGQPMSPDEQADLQGKSTENSDLASAAAYATLGIDEGDLATASSFQHNPNGLVDAALLGHPESAHVVASAIALEMDLNKIARSTDALGPADLDLLALMLNFYAKTWVAHIPNALDDVQGIHGLDIGQKEAVEKVQQEGMRTKPSILTPLDQNSPRGPVLLEALKTYHLEDCTRYQSYFANFDKIKLQVEMDTDLGPVPLFEMRPNLIRSGPTCLVTIGLSSLAVGIQWVGVKSCQNGSGGDQLCTLDIAFNCPWRGLVSDMPLLAPLTGEICSYLDQNWRATVSTSIRQQSDLSWRIQSLTLLKLLP